MPLGARDLHSLTYDLAENQAKKCAGLDYIILFHFVVINANFWRSKATAGCCLLRFVCPAIPRKPLVACLPGRDPSVPPLPTFYSEKLLNTKSVLTTSTWLGLTDSF